MGAPRFGTLTAAAALARLQHLLDDVAWSATQLDEQPGGHGEAQQLDALAHRLQGVIDVYTDGQERVTLDLDPDEVLTMQAYLEEEAAREAQEKRWADEA
jgi:hypothetical protein